MNEKVKIKVDPTIHSAPMSDADLKLYEKVIDEGAEKGKVWQRRFGEHQIRDEKDFKSHVYYIHYNPAKHKLVASPKDWPYSTFKRYLKAVDTQI